MQQWAMPVTIRRCKFTAFAHSRQEASVVMVAAASGGFYAFALLVRERSQAHRPANNKHDPLSATQPCLGHADESIMMMLLCVRCSSVRAASGRSHLCSSRYDSSRDPRRQRPDELSFALNLV